MLSNRTIELVRLQVNIKDVVSDYATLQSSGRKFKCCCPLHNEKTPSFHIDPVRNTWHCFGACGEGGDAISFIEKKEKLSFIEAVRFLAKKHNIPVEEDTQVSQYVQQRALLEEQLHLPQLSKGSASCSLTHVCPLLVTFWGQNEDFFHFLAK